MKKIFSMVSLFFCLLASGQPQLAYNKSFEITKGNNSFICWSIGDMMGKYSFSQEIKDVHSGKYALGISSEKAIRMTNDLDVGYFSATVPNELLKGRKKVKLDAWIKTDSHSTRAAIWFDQFSLKGPLSQTSSVTDTVKTLKGWQHIQMEKTLDSAATATYFGGWLNGKGKALFDDFTLLIDGEPVKDIAPSLAQFSRTELAWLNKNAVPLASIDSANKNNDLDSLSKWIGDARIIGIGEPTHGTSEVARIRLRVFKYLVEKKGFNTYMVEDNLPEVGLMNDYVLYGRDTAFNILKKYFFGGNPNEEMLGIVKWMRNYNVGHEKKIQFRGMDMQSPRIARLNIARFANKYDTTLNTLTNLFEQVFTRQSANKDTTKNLILKDSLKNYSRLIREHIEKNKTWYNSKISKDTVNWLTLNTAVLEQYYWAYTFFLRDSCMAKNVYDYCQQYPDAKILIHAHNVHISRYPRLLGNHLDNYFGKNYYPIAFATAEGTYTARVDVVRKEYKTYDLDRPYVGTSEYFLQKANEPNYFLSLKDDTANKASAWLTKELDFRAIGAAFLNVQFAPAILRRNYDAIIFVKKTTNWHSYIVKKE
jgi:erythromycin esterase